VRLGWKKDCFFLASTADGHHGNPTIRDGLAMVTRTEWSAALALALAELGELGVEVEDLQPRGVTFSRADALAPVDSRHPTGPHARRARGRQRIGFAFAGVAAGSGS
jgi:hypothetical protein